MFCHPNIQGACKHRGCHNIWGIQTCWGSPNISMHPNIWGCPKIQGASKCIQGIQTYVGCPNIWDILKYRGVKTYRGHLNKWGSDQTYKWASKNMGDVQTYRGHTPLYLYIIKKACFFRLIGCPYAPIHLGAPLYV